MNSNKDENNFGVEGTKLFCESFGNSRLTSLSLRLIFSFKHLHFLILIAFHFKNMILHEKDAII